MTFFDVYDGVVLKHDSSLYGTISRTHADSSGPLDDELIIAHAEVPPDAINEFVTAGVPPVGYVFVRFADEAAGSSLVHEDDLTLLSRAFQIGDNVTREGSTMAGTVINVDEHFTLEPIASRKEVTKSLCIDTGLSTCTSACASHPPPPFGHPNPHALIHNVPSRELRRAQDVVKDDYIMSNDWVGLVDHVEYEIVIALENKSIVVVTGTDALHIPVPDHGKPLVALPENDGFVRPDILVATQGWASTIPVQNPRPGSFVIIGRSRLRGGRWIRGSFDPKCPPQGTVLDVRAHLVSVDWMANNAYSGALSKGPPDFDLFFYENLRNFQDQASLRPRQDLTVYDAGRMPVRRADLNIASTEPRVLDEAPSHTESEGTQNIFSGQDMTMGIHVRFRDTTAAAVKYHAIEEDSHGKFISVASEHFEGWDLNEFKVIYMQQQATVLWQDGTISTVDSTTLKDYGLFEIEFAPTDIVLKRDGMRQRPVRSKRVDKTALKDFNEMTLFEQPHDLLPAKVGVIQSVDPSERVARVRWYKEPKIEIRASGQILAPGSQFGPIGDDVEDVSLYEIMSFPSLARRRRDMCIVADPLEMSRRAEGSIGRGVSATARLISPVSRVANEIPAPSSRSSPRDNRDGVEPSRGERLASPRDITWIGEIVAMGLDGSITVRLGAALVCRDISIEPDAILGIIDERDHDPDGDFDDFMDVDSWGDSASDWSDDGSVEPIAESVEYEGGERLDNDSGDENWVSDDEGFSADDGPRSEGEDSDVEMTDDQVRPTENPHPLSNLLKLLPSEAPPQFQLLEIEPPPDQFGLHSRPGGSGKASKRIMREHKILASSLPEGAIYVRTYESRLDLLRCLIIGPRDTPYESAPFLIDLYLPEGFPEEPPMAHFHSWTSGLGRINPNLYEEGKICLSLLGTWSGKNASERWSDKATILQLLVSIQGLVFVKKPFYNEAGFEGYENDTRYALEAEQYNEKAFVMARAFIKHAILRPPAGLKDVLAWLYLRRDSSQSTDCLLGQLLQQSRELIRQSEEARLQKDGQLLDASGGKEDPTRVFLKPLSRGASVMLIRLIDELQPHLSQLSSA